jgi:hypothetical protein
MYYILSIYNLWSFQAKLGKVFVALLQKQKNKIKNN